MMWDWMVVHLRLRRPSSVFLQAPPIWPPLTALRWSVSRSWGWPGPRPAARPGRGQTRRGKSSHYWGANIFFYRYFIFYHWAGLWVAVALEWDCWQFYTLMTWWGSELPHHSHKLLLSLSLCPLLSLSTEGFLNRDARLLSSSHVFMKMSLFLQV